jgi:chemotaxis protein MotB
MIRRYLALGLSAAVASGCVSKGKYDELAAQNALLQQRTEVLVDVATALGQEVALLDNELAILELEQAELAATMEVMIVAGAVRMKMLKDGLSVVLDDEVLFGSGSAELSPAGKQAVADLASQLSDQPYQIVVIGNTDTVPVRANSGYASNWALAAARASAVVRHMADQGIPKQQLVAVSFGDTRPVASNGTAEGRSENRRIEVRLRPVVVTEEGEVL